MSSTSARVRAAADVILDAVPTMLDNGDRCAVLGQHELDLMGDKLIEVGAVSIMRNPMTGHINVDASPLAMAAVCLVGHLVGRLAKISDAPTDAAVAEVREVLSGLPEVWPEA